MSLTQSLIPALTALCATVLMVQAGVGKRQLSWRTERARRPWSRLPWRFDRHA